LRCRGCETVYAAAAPPAALLAEAYAEADYDSSEEAALAADTYAAALAPVVAALPQRGRVLEIGTGTGVLLQRFLDAGFREAVGIEPSAAAIAAAAPAVRGMIRKGVFVESDFKPCSFDLICCFQTLEHVADRRRSPIIDIEHLQLFCRSSLNWLLRDAGLGSREIRTLVNRYPLRYWLRLTPLPGGMKRAVGGVFASLRLDRARFGFNVGNLLAVGRKPG